jgi:hypothetical protein
MSTPIFQEGPEPLKVTPLIDPDRRMTAEDIAKIHKAMEATGGNRRAAAEILGIEKSRVDYAVAHNPALAAKWKVTAALLDGETNVNEITTISRKPPEPLALTQQERTVVALTVQERTLNKSLAKLGFKGKEIEAISSVEEFAGAHFDQTLSIMHGGLLKSAMRLMLLAENIEQRYLQDEGLGEKDRNWWWNQYFRILEKLRDMNEQTNKAALTKALIEIKKKGNNGLGKPGFSSGGMAIQINAPNSTIKTGDLPISE